MSVSKNRLLDKKWIKKRWKKLNKIRHWYWSDPKKDIKDYKLKNNNEMNRVCNCGVAKKRKARHGSATYRQHGTYGKAIQRNNNELRQYIDMNHQIKEYREGK